MERREEFLSTKSPQIFISGESERGSFRFNEVMEVLTFKASPRTLIHPYLWDTLLLFNLKEMREELLQIPSVRNLIPSSPPPIL